MNLYDEAILRVLITIAVLIHVFGSLALDYLYFKDKRKKS